MRPLLIIGSAACLWDDLTALGDWLGEIMAVNRAGAHHEGHLDHWVSLHPDQLGRFMAERAQRGGNLDCTTWSRSEADDVGIDHVVTDLEQSGSSGLFAVRIALQRLGHQRVVLAGIPMDNGPHFYDGPRLSGPPFVPYRPTWRLAAKVEFHGRVRSLSGWTSELLGRPDPAWLEG